MKIEKNKVRDINIAYIGGGSRGWAWTLMSDLANEEDISGCVKLYDIDYEAAKANEMIGNQYATDQANGKWHYTAVEHLSDTLQGADFVIISILPGTLDEMESDVHLPEQYGIYQSVGDTTGPGGYIRALRTIPMITYIAEQINKFAPKSWVINYTNPMSLCMKALYYAFPEIKAFGCCHEVFGIQKVLAKMAAISLGIEHIDRENIHVNVFGINHFTWFDKASYQGHDLLPIWSDFVAKNYEDGFIDEESEWVNTHFGCEHRVKFDLYRRYGYIGAAGDRHLAEFMPGDFYLQSPDQVEEWKFSLTPVSWRKVDLINRLEKSKRLRIGTELISLKKSGEEGTRLIRCLLGLDRIVSNANIPNQGQLSNVALGTIVESNVVFSRDRIQPVGIQQIPDQIVPLIEPHIINQELIFQAALTCNRAMVIEAFTKDPLVTVRGLSHKDISSLVEQMLENTREYLPQGWFIN